MPNHRTTLIIFALIFSAGVTPIAIRFAQAQGMPSLVIVFMRLWVVSMALLPLVWSRYRHEFSRLTNRDYVLIGIAGFWHALNLFMLFFALEYTSVLVTMVLRRTTPLWIIAPEVVLLGAVFTRRTWMSLVVSFVGVLLIALGGAGVVQAGSHPLLGAGIAAFGAICLGVYLLIGRKFSRRIPPLFYSWLVFTAAGIVTAVFLWIVNIPLTGYTLSAYGWALMVTLLAQVIGHIAIILGLRVFSATAMSIILQLGVVVSAVMALFTFGEIPSSVQVMGSVLVVVGVVLVTMEQSQRKRLHRT